MRSTVPALAFPQNEQSNFFEERFPFLPHSTRNLLNDFCDSLYDTERIQRTQSLTKSSLYRTILDTLLDSRFSGKPTSKEKKQALANKIALRARASTENSCPR
jgi:hypothetical protein